MKIFSGSSTAKLAKEIARKLKVKFGDCELSYFPNGENRVWIKENCTSEIVFILQNFSGSVDASIMQFCFMVDAIKRLKPKKIIGVIPWFGYAKQNHVFREGETLAAEVVARIVSGSGIDEVVLLDVHSGNVKNFFTVPVTELSARELFVDWISSRLKVQGANSDFVVVSPDVGALPRNKHVAEKLNLPLFVIDKERNLETGKITIKGIKPVNGSLTIKQLNNGTILMFDDMILSGGTLVKDAAYVKQFGAKDIYFFATHYCPTKDTLTNLSQAKVKKVIVTNSLEFDIPRDLNYKLLTIDLSRLIADKINDL